MHLLGNFAKDKQFNTNKSTNKIFENSHLFA